ncbi:MAG: methylmalonyl-CoA mutase [Candidatus Hodarchaeota archaeon]
MLNKKNTKKQEKGENERKKEFFTDSGIPVKTVYTPLNLEEIKFDYLEHLGFPGQYPFTRGREPLMYRRKFWVRSQFSGFGDPQDANRGYKYILEHGQSGFSIALDLPTQMGHDADHKLAHGEIGKTGVSISSLRDMEDLLNGIPWEKVEELSSDAKIISVIITAMYICLAEKQGFSPNKIRVRVQTDGLKDFIATGNYIFPPKDSLRIITDLIEYFTKNLPNWVPITVCGYHIREAGANAVQEVAFTLSNAIAYIESLLARGLNVDEFAPKFNLLMGSHMDFAEEIAKLRATKRLWAKILRERFGANDQRSCAIRMVCYTAGSPLTIQQPLNNVMRVTLEALAAVLSGVDELFLSSYDEAYCLPSEEAMRVAMMTQQIIAFETGITNTIDPVGGSYYVETLTSNIEKEALEYIKTIDEMGGSIKAIENGYFKKEIAKSAYKRQMQIKNKEKIIVGLNEYAMEEEEEMVKVFGVNPEVEKIQMQKLEKLRRERNNDSVKESLKKLKEVAKSNDNLYMAVLEAVRSYATLGEICDVLREVFGHYLEGPSYSQIKSRNYFFK